MFIPVHCPGRVSRRTSHSVGVALAVLLEGLTFLLEAERLSNRIPRALRYTRLTLCTLTLRLQTRDRQYVRSGQSFAGPAPGISSPDQCVLCATYRSPSSVEGFLEASGGSVILVCSER